MLEHENQNDSAELHVPSEGTQDFQCFCTVVLDILVHLLLLYRAVKPNVVLEVHYLDPRVGTHTSIALNLHGFISRLSSQPGTVFLSPIPLAHDTCASARYRCWLGIN